MLLMARAGCRGRRERALAILVALGAAVLLLAAYAPDEQQDSIVAPSGGAEPEIHPTFDPQSGLWLSEAEIPPEQKTAYEADLKGTELCERLP